jgi:hypothetical protein
MLLQVPEGQLQIQDPHMLYFLTCPVYFIDRYNTIYNLNKYLTDYFHLNLTYVDNILEFSETKWIERISVGRICYRVCNTIIYKITLTITGFRGA